MSAPNEKKLNESQFTSDSGFHSGFQDSREILTEFSTDNAELGNPADKEEQFDSGILPSETAAIQITPFIPEYLKGTPKRNSPHPVVDKYFEQDEDGFTGLHLAILQSNWQAIHVLTMLASDISYLNIRSNQGQTALHLACILNQQQTCKKLIDAGADLNARDSRCQTPLIIACENELPEIVQIILSAVRSLKPDMQRLANLEHWNLSGETSFHIACRLRNVPIARALMNAGANVNAREGRSGKTALMTAVESKSTEVIAFLCEECSSLSIDIENYSGLTAYQICLLTAQDELADYFVSKFGATPFLTYDSDMDYDDSSSDTSFSDDVEKNMLISKIAEIAVN